MTEGYPANGVRMRWSVKGFYGLNSNDQPTLHLDQWPTTVATEDQMNAQLDQF